MRPLPLRSTPLKAPPQYTTQLFTSIIDNNSISYERSPPSTVHRSLPSHFNPFPTDGVNELTKQLQQVLQEKANLEGQLESIIEECQSTLKERASLQSKLTKAEVDLQSFQDETTGRSLKIDDQVDEGVSDLGAEINRMESILSQKRRELATLGREMEKEKLRAKQLSEDVVSARQSLQVKEQQLVNASAANKNLQDSVDSKSDAIMALNGQISTLKASLDTAESSKTWLHNQLQDSLDSKSKLQDELRTTRAANITNTIKLDNLQNENALLQQQLSELQSQVLQDKAKLVSELEAIEADVLTKEDSFVKIQSDKESLARQVDVKTKQLEQVSGRLAQQTAAASEAENQLADLGKELDTIKVQLQRVEEEKIQLTDKIQKHEQALVSKDQELDDSKISRGSLQQRVQQLETSLVTKEGSLQGLRDSNDILKHELDIVKQTNESLEKEIEGLQEIKVKLEGDKEAESEMKNKLGRELHHVKGRLGQMEKDLREMEVELAKKDEEIHQKDEILNDLQSQSEGLRDHFKSLQDKFKVISEESEASLEEKDKTISQLFQEREDLKTQNDAMKSSQNDLVDKLNSLKEQIAHLQGQLDTAKDTGIQLDDFKRILAEKNSLDKQLASERLLHQQEQIKSKAKIARLETEGKDFNKESKRKEEKLREELQMAEDEIKCLKLQLENVANEKVSGDREEMTEEIERLNEALEEKNMTIESLENDKAILKEEKANLKERLDEEEDKISEIERASTLVAKQLKEEAERAVKGLEEEKQKLTIETEHLKGRLAGISTAQQCTREHANSLEAALAQKDAQLRQLTGETQSMLADRDKEITELKDVVTNLKDAENSLKIELETTLTDKLLEKQRADETAREASRKEEKIQELLGSLTKGEDGQRLKEKNDMLQMENNDLKAELQTMKQQISIAQMTNDVSKRELAEKTKHGDMLEQKLQMTTGQLEQAQLELQQLQDYLKSQRPTYKEKIQQPLNERSPDEIDGSFKMKGRNDPDEISTLKSQLGNKSKTLKNLQLCLRSLKDDMSHIQLSMDHYSSSLQSSYKTSQQLESKIKDLEISRNSSSEPS